MTARRSPLRVSSSLAILVFDWLVYAITMSSHARDWPYATIFGAFGAMVTVAILEQKDATFTQVLLRALVAGAVVAVPLPLLGTVVAAAFLIWSVVGQSHRTH